MPRPRAPGFAAAPAGNAPHVKDAFLLLDLIQRFDHRDGDKLLASARERLPAILAARDHARAANAPVVYVNDHGGRWDADFPGLVREAREAAGGDVIEQIAPQPGDRAVLKARYSAFDHTPLVILLRELEIDRIVIAGAATEMCVTQTAIDARELGFKVTILSDACARIDEELEHLSLVYAERVVGAFVERVEDWQPGAAVSASR
jgi:nicotinamidase-related amidase